MQKLPLSLLVVAAISSTSFAQTKILSFTSSVVFTNTTKQPWGIWGNGEEKPTGVFTSVGSNQFIAIGMNYYTNRVIGTTNKASGITNIFSNSTPVPMGVAYVFKFINPTNVNPTPVLSFTNTNNHTYNLSGSYITSNSLGVAYFQAGVRTNITITYGMPDTNIVSDFWATETCVYLTTTNGGTTWTTNPILGSVQTNFINTTGSSVPNPNRNFWVNILRATNGNAVFDVYNP